MAKHEEETKTASIPLSSSRRSATIALGAMAAGLGLPFSAPRGQQPGGRVVVATWGGDYSALQTKILVEPYMKPKGFEVVFDPGTEPTRKTKVLAERRLPRGTVDVLALTAPGSFELNSAGGLEQLDASAIPNFKNINPKLVTGYSIPHVFSTRGILYSTKHIPVPPKSYADIWDPKYAGKVGIVDFQHIPWFESAALINGGSFKNYEPGKAKLLELKKSGFRIYPTIEALQQAFKSGEVWISIQFKARIVFFQDAGLEVAMAVPKEGAVLYVSDFAVAKNAPNKPGALAYLNAALDPAAQIQFARDFKYNPTVSNVELPPDIAQRIGISKEERELLVLQDSEYLAKNDFQLREWWDKVLKG